MGFNSSKVFVIVLVLLIAGAIYFVTQKETAEAIGLWIKEGLSQRKVEVTEVKPVEVRAPPKVFRVDRPNPKLNSTFTYHYKLYSKGDQVLNAESITWRVVSLDEAQVTWESEDHQIESFSRNPFLPPRSASESKFRATPRLDYLSSPDIFPLNSSHPKAVQIQDRTVDDSKPYNWSCLVSGQENRSTMGGDFLVDIITCVATGGKEGIETFRYAQALGHWVARERSGFGLPKMTVELVSFTD